MAILGQNRQSKATICIWRLQKCNFYTFHKDHFNPKIFLTASVQILVLKTHAFWDLGHHWSNMAGKTGHFVAKMGQSGPIHTPDKSETVMFLS